MMMTGRPRRTRRTGRNIGWLFAPPQYNIEYYSIIMDTKAQFLVHYRRKRKNTKPTKKRAESCSSLQSTFIFTTRNLLHTINSPPGQVFPGCKIPPTYSGAYFIKDMSIFYQRSWSSVGRGCRIHSQLYAGTLPTIRRLIRRQSKNTTTA